MTARAANAVGFLACAALLAYAYYAQFVLRLEPCPLCIFQRVGVLAMACVFGVAALHDPKSRGRGVYGVLAVLAALWTAGVAARQLYIQSLPPGSVPACGASLDFMLKVFPLTDVVRKVLTGSGECARVDWRFLGLAMPGWVLIAALALGAWGIGANLPARRPVLRF